MDSDDRIEGEQAKIWNGHAGRTWVAAQDLLDEMMRPFEALLAEVAPAGGRLLDVGCGTGATTLATARAGAHCTGVDISLPMIELARSRAAAEGLAVEFVRDDVQDHRFEPDRFDAIVSRFGVMFFADPVKAFANLRDAIRPGGQLRFIAWRSPGENPFMTAAERAAAPDLPDMPARQPHAPGQFAFADRARIEAILRDGGWNGIDIEAIDVPCVMPASELAGYYTRMGPVGLHLQQADAIVRARLLPKLREAFEPFVDGDKVRFTAACWLVDARSA